MKRLKAYQVSDGNDGCCIQFATNGATARREGANEIGCEWADIDYCNRRPVFDQYAPGPVPPQALIDSGWWMECGGCHTHVTEDTENRVFGANGWAYCSQVCADKDQSARASTNPIPDSN